MTPRVFRLAILSSALSLLASAAGAADCSAESYRQFDFWIGHWQVTANGKPAGTNTITREQDGCVLREEWRGASGVTGTSLNYFDRSDGRWHQVWIDRSGGVLVLAGTAPQAGEMLLESAVTAPGPRQRIHWRLRDDGVVEQHWQQSADGGVTWTTAFLGEYRRDGSAPAGA